MKQKLQSSKNFNQDEKIIDVTCDKVFGIETSLNN